MEQDAVKESSLPSTANDRDVEDGSILAPFTPTCETAIRVALDLLLADETNNDFAGDTVLFDLGCGDGRLLLAAVQRCATIRCVGIERDPILVEKAMSAARAQLSSEQQSRIDIRLGDAMDPDEAKITTCSSADNIGAQCRGLKLRDATALYLYLLPKGLVQLHQQHLLDSHQKIPLLRKVVTYLFRLRAWTPARVDRTSKASAPVYLYQIANT